MDVGKRRTLVKVLVKSEAEDELKNPIFEEVGKFYASVFQPAPKDAINAGALANVQYLQITMLWSDVERLKIKSSMLVEIAGVRWEINTTPYMAFANNRLYARLDVSRKANNG